MLAEQKKKTNIGVGIGILLQIAGRVIVLVHTPPSLAIALGGLVLIIIGLIFFIWGCMNYAEGKGYSRWLGLLGLLSCIGLIILIFMPDQYKSGGPPVGGGPVPSRPGVWPPPPDNPT